MKVFALNLLFTIVVTMLFSVFLSVLSYFIVSAILKILISFELVNIFFAYFILIQVVQSLALIRTFNLKIDIAKSYGNFVLLTYLIQDEGMIKKIILKVSICFLVITGMFIYLMYILFSKIIVDENSVILIISLSSFLGIGVTYLLIDKQNGEKLLDKINSSLLKILFLCIILIVSAVQIVLSINSKDSASIFNIIFGVVSSVASFNEIYKNIKNMYDEFLKELSEPIDRIWEEGVQKYGLNVIIDKFKINFIILKSMIINYYREIMIIKSYDIVYFIKIINYIVFVNTISILYIFRSDSINNYFTFQIREYYQYIHFSHNYWIVMGMKFIFIIYLIYILIRRLIYMKNIPRSNLKYLAQELGVTLILSALIIFSIALITTHVNTPITLLVAVMILISGIIELGVRAYNGVIKFLKED